MLKSLAVENFAIIEKAHLEFSAGVSTITGETGAGKSILIEALGLALGQRAQSHYLSGTGKLAVTLDIELARLPAAAAWLAENDLASDRECILRRTLTQDGRSRAFINGVQVPLAQLQSLSGQLIEIVGQNTQQSLMQTGKHIDILDAQCEHADTLDKIRATQRRWNSLSQKLEKQLEQSEELAEHLTLLRYQVRELEEFTPADGEFAEVDQTHRRLAKKTLLREEAHKALALLDETESSDASSLIAVAAQALRRLTDADTGLATACEQLDTALNHVQIASHEIRGCLERIDTDEEDYHKLERRLEGYLNLARKYKTVPEALASLYLDFKKKLGKIENPDLSPGAIEQELNKLKTRYAVLADKMSTRRRKAATALSRQVSKTLGELNMQSAEFTVVLKPDEDDTPKPRGQEKVEFFVRTNVGQEAGPITRISSGGELSRVSLAIQAALAANNPLPTLVFDEVDAGVGGRTAEMVGKLLKKIGRSVQVLCVTHLPQVAAQADHHFRVDKREHGGQTRISVTELSAEGRRGEIARMVAGAEITDKSLAHAGEMLEQTNKSA